MREVSLQDVRRVLCHVHGLVNQKNGFAGALEVVRRHSCIQQDPIDVAGRNADLTLQSRVSDYQQAFLAELLYGKRALFEYFCKMMSILPVETFPLFRHKMMAFEKKAASFLHQHRRETRQILRAAERGPVSSRELSEFGTMEWGWGRSARLSNVLLTRLWVSGKLMIHHREGGQKFYSLTEEVIPKNILDATPPQKGEDATEIARLIVSSSRLVMPYRAPEQWYEVGKSTEVKEILTRLERKGDIFAVRVEGAGDILFAPADDEGLWENPPSFESDMVRFIAPLDPLLWNRHLFSLIFEREYRWEVYKKPSERKYGYYCLPILFNGDFVGLVEPFFSKKEGTLEIRSLHVFPGLSQKEPFRQALREEMERFSIYLKATRIVVKKGGRWLGKAGEK